MLCNRFRSEPSKSYMITCSSLLWCAIIRILSAGQKVISMEAVKDTVVGWLDWAAEYAVKQPQEFFSNRTLSRLFAPVLYLHMCSLEC